MFLQKPKTAKAEYAAYIGTYSENGSKGIYIYHFDSSCGRLEYIGASGELENPSYVMAAHGGKYLYAVSETDSYQGNPGGAAGAFSINRHTGELDFLNCKPTNGRSPCHLFTDGMNRCLFTANYNDGSVTMFSLDSDGHIGEITSLTRHHGSGPNAARQEKSHAHYVALTPDEKYLCVADLGIDKLMLYDFDPVQGNLLPASNPYIPITPGSGPRHMEFSPDGRFAYVINELSSDINVFQYSPTVSFFSEIQCISTLPEDYAGDNYCAAIHISPDGRFLYASNRGHDSMAIFNINKLTGILEFVTTCSTLGKYPRDFSIDPTGRYLYAANQLSGTIVSFSIDNTSGSLKTTGDVIEIPSPTCIKFVALDAL